MTHACSNLRLAAPAALLLASGLNAMAARRAESQTVWQGTYRLPATAGAMEIVMSGEHLTPLDIRFAFNGRTTDAKVSRLQSNGSALMFRATLGGTTYQFRGSRQEHRITGTLSADRPGGDQGTWSVVPVGDSASARDPGGIPSPTGRFRTARVTFHWIDSTRPELATRAPSDVRQVLVHLVYPADSIDGVLRAPYLTDADAMRGVWSDLLVERLSQLKASDLQQAPPAKTPNRFPVVVFMPGRGQKALIYSALFDELVSHGFIVAAIDPAFNPPAMRLPDGTVLHRPSAAESGWPVPKTLEEFLTTYRESVLHWTRDISFVLDQLARLQNAPGPFAGRLDLSRVGALGHSFGGQAAGTARLFDARVHAAINLDGNEKGTGFESIPGLSDEGKPFLWIETPYQPPSPADLRGGLVTTERQWNDLYADGDRQMSRLSSGGLRVTIERLGIDHMDFSDQPFWDVKQPVNARDGKLRTLMITRAYCRAFFEATLLGQWDDLHRLVDESSTTQPDVVVRQFGSLWPK